MTLYCLVEQGLIDLRFTPMSLEAPPPNYVRLDAARHLPIAWIESGIVAGKDCSGTVISSTEELELLMEKLGAANLNVSLNQQEILRTEEVFEDLYINLMNYIRYDHRTPLINTLTKVNDFLRQKGERYLLDDYVTYPDCQLMPKLQHLRVAGRAYKGFDVPEHLTHLWAYVKQMYETRAFTCSCPSDRDILLHYQEKDPLPKNVRLSLLGAEYLSTVPAQAINGGCTK
ncbi:unnamed protein product [Dicrocoelium dendriticum]|nr:unnamed protein product [Dicrocoelium dendriticum]